MSKVTIWTQAGCPLCEKVKAHFGEGNYEEHPVTNLISGNERNDEALAQLAMQNMELPLVQVDDAFVSISDILPNEAAA